MHIEKEQTISTHTNLWFGVDCMAFIRFDTHRAASSRTTKNKWEQLKNFDLSGVNLTRHKTFLAKLKSCPIFSGVMLDESSCPQDCNGEQISLIRQTVRELSRKY